MAEKQARNRGKGRQFQKGVSGNPNGRPRLGDAAAEKVRAILAEKNEKGIERARAILLKMAKKAESGDVKAAIFLFERGFGKAPQPVTGPDGGPHTIIIERRG